MKRNFLKRTLALSIVAAMTLSSVPTSLVFAEEDAVVEADVVLDEADVVVEEDTEAAAEEEAVEEESADAGISIASVEEVSDVPEEVAVEEGEEATVASEAYGYAYAPAAVTNLQLQTEGTSEDGTTISSPTLHWDWIETADHYNVWMVDSLGNVYANYYSSTKSAFSYVGVSNPS